MKVTDAIQYLREDLERYAGSGKARPETVSFRQKVLNTIIAALNRTEGQVEHIRKEALAKIEGLKADLRQRDQLLNLVAGDVDGFKAEEAWMWSGNTPRILGVLHGRIAQETNRSMSEARAAKEREMLHDIELELRHYWRDIPSLSLALAKALRELEDLKQYCLMYGMDLEQFEHLDEDLRQFLRPEVSTRPYTRAPSYWTVPIGEHEGRTLSTREYDSVRKRHWLERWRMWWTYRNSAPALVAMNDKRILEGVITPLGIRLGQYKNPDDVVLSVLYMLRSQRDWKRISERHPEQYARLCAEHGCVPHEETPWLPEPDTEHAHQAEAHPPMPEPEPEGTAPF